jgi:hypothetical protein
LRHLISPSRSGAAFFYGVASGIEFDGAGSGRIGPAAWPKIILGLMLATALFGTAKAFAGGPRGPRRASDAGAGRRSEVPASTWPQLTIAGVALFVGYTIALEPLGFIVATALLLGLFMLVGRYRNYKLILGYEPWWKPAFLLHFQEGGLSVAAPRQGPLSDRDTDADEAHGHELRAAPCSRIFSTSASASSPSFSR